MQVFLPFYIALKQKEVRIACLRSCLKVCRRDEKRTQISLMPVTKAQAYPLCLDILEGITYSQEFTTASAFIENNAPHGTEWLKAGEKSISH